MDQDENADGSAEVNSGNGLDRAAQAAILAERTLTGDLRDYILRLFREQRNPWSLLTESQQTGLAAEIEAQSEHVVRRVVQLVAAKDFTSVGVGLEQLSFKPKGVEAKMSFAPMSADVRHQLVDAQGGRIVIVIADPDRFRGSRGLARIDRDEPELPLANGEAGEQPGEDATAQSVDAAPAAGEQPAAADGPDNPAVGYTLGYEDSRSGKQWDACPFPEGQPEELRYRAGMLQQQYDSLADDHRGQQTAKAKTADYFRERGRAAAASRASHPTLADCPLAAWMPAAKWWREGLLAAIAEAGQIASNDMATPDDCPYAAGTTEAGAWLSGYEPALPAEKPQPQPRRRGRPRREPPADQPEA